MPQENNIFFTTPDKPKWLKLIVDSYQRYNSQGNGIQVFISFGTDIAVKDLMPMHLVTLACLIQFLSDHNWQANLSPNNPSVDDYIYNELRFRDYWLGQKNHVDTADSSHIFNLWRIVDGEKELFAARVEEYLRNNYFKNKDLSAISLSLKEAFYNVFDHASAGNNAFSLIFYDKDTHVLYAAISDFGIGIVRSVKKYLPSIIDDKQALLKAIENNFTVKSAKWNKGKGLDNILSSTDSSRLCSGRALLLYKKKDKYDMQGNKRVYDIDFDFPGTLLYFEVDISQMDDVEILDSFEF